MSKSCIRTEGAPLINALVLLPIVGTLKDQTDREEHCSTLVGCVCTFAKISFPSFGIVFVFVFVLCPLQAQEAYMFHLVGFDTNSRCGAAMWCGVVYVMVWCGAGVVWCGVVW
jgi:hypothetical protein